MDEEEGVMPDACIGDILLLNRFEEGVMLLAVLLLKLLLLFCPLTRALTRCWGVVGLN